MTTAPVHILKAAARAHFVGLDTAQLALFQAALGINEAVTRILIEHQAIATACDVEPKPTPRTLKIICEVMEQAWEQYCGDLRKIELALATVAATVRASIDDAERLRDGRYAETFERRPA